MAVRLLDDAPLSPPLLQAPPDGVVLEDRTPSFHWQAPTGTTQVELVIAPDNPIYPSIHIVSNLLEAYTVPDSAAWCCLSPDTGYRWRVRTTDSPIRLIPEDPYWGPWSKERRFRVLAHPTQS